MTPLISKVLIVEFAKTTFATSDISSLSVRLELTTEALAELPIPTDPIEELVKAANAY